MTELFFTHKDGYFRMLTYNCPIKEKLTIDIL